MSTGKKKIFFNALTSEDELHLIKKFKDEGWDCYLSATKSVALKAMVLVGRDKVNAYPLTQEDNVLLTKGIQFDAIVHLSPDVNLRATTTATQTEWIRIVETYIQSYQQFIQSYKSVLKNKHASFVLVGPYLLVNDTLTEEQQEAISVGLDAVLKMWARELGIQGIRINTIHPGFMSFHLNVGVDPNFIKRIPLQRLGTFDDLFQSLQFLLSENANYITGNAIYLNGGYTA